MILLNLFKCININHKLYLLIIQFLYGILSMMIFGTIKNNTHSIEIGILILLMKY